MAFIYDLVDTWNNAASTFTAIKMNVIDNASNAASLLMDLQVGTVSKFKVGKDGLITLPDDTGIITPGGGIMQLVVNNVSRFGRGDRHTFGVRGGTGVTNGYFQFGWIADPFGNGTVVRLAIDDANILAQRNGTISQTLRLYGTYTDASNYERGYLTSDTNGFTIGTEAAGTGTKRPVRIVGPTLASAEAVSALDISQTWNTSGTPTAFKLNVTDTTSNANSLLMDLQTDGRVAFSVSKAPSSGYSSILIGDGLILRKSRNVNYAQIFLTGAQLAISGAGGSKMFYTSSDVGFGWWNVTDINAGGGVDLFLTRKGSGNLRLGNFDASSPVAQTLSVQSVVAGTTNTNGADFTITGSQGTGTGIGGSIIFQVSPAAVTTGTAQNALQTAFTIRPDLRVGFNDVYLGPSQNSRLDFTTIISGTPYTTFSIVDNLGFRMASSYEMQWSGTNSSKNNPTLRLVQDAANILAQRNDTNAQTFRLYNTYTDASNQERADFSWIGNTFYIRTFRSGTGQPRPLNLRTEGSVGLFLGTNGTERWSVDANGNFIAWADATYDIGGNGVNRPRNIYAQNTVTSAGALITGSSGYIAWTNRSLFKSPSDGIVTLFNWNENDFNRLQFGGTTSAFPALKRSSTAIAVRLADDSADAPITASSGTFSDTATNVSALAASGYSLTGSSSVPMIDLTGTWNTTGNPAGIKMNITNTASGANAMLMDLQTGGVSRFNVSKAGVVSAVSAAFSDTTSDVSSIVATGYSLTGSSAVPMVDLSGTWGTTGTPTLFKMNVVDNNSNAASLLMDLQVGGASRFKINKSGSNLFTVGGHAFISDANALVLTNSAGSRAIASRPDFTVIPTTSAFVWGDPASFNFELSLYRDASDILAQRRGTAAQAFRIYNTYTDASNYERAKFAWSSNVLQIGTEKAGTGTGRDIDFQRDGTTRFALRQDVASTTFAGVDASDIWTPQNGGIVFRTNTTGYVGVYVTSPADSVLRFAQPGSGGFGRLQFGGGTSAFPALKRSGTSLQVRLADDSADAPLSASSLTTTDTTTNVSAIASTGYALSGSSSTPMVDLAGTWNTTGTPTAIKLNVTDTASNTNSLLMDLQVGGVSEFSVSKTGTVSAPQFITPNQTLTDGATITFNADLSSVGTVTLTGSGRTITPTNLKAGGTYVLFIKQDGTGNRTITTWTNFRWQGGIAPTLSTTANAIDIVSGISDGTYIYAAIQQGFA